jgi:tRNA/tmRNA/rRNA uracil-C5-methylase (TrmA/RlmC/RlmD family)
MSVGPGSILHLDIEKPAAGGRMLARHHGLVLLVEGAIPGERVAARVQSAKKGMAYAETVDLLEASADRREPSGDARCGGQSYAHISYPRQLRLKGEVIRDAFARIGRMPLPGAPAVTGSPETGYRMRARLHVSGGRVGFFREGTREICDAGATGQFLPATQTWIEGVERTIRDARLSGLTDVEMAENVPGDERACHLELQAGCDMRAFAALAVGLAGLSAGRADRPGGTVLAGAPVVSDVLHARHGDPASAFRLRRHARAFFQGNRFLLEPLVRHVLSHVPAGPVVDVYAGVGLFGLALAAAGQQTVTLVESDPIGGADLLANAAPFGDRVRVERTSVEAFVASPARLRETTVVVDPPRTGLSRQAVAGLLAAQPPRIVYVSCDVATLARDSRTLVDGGCELASLAGVDLFPGSAHIETIGVFTREG